MSILRRSMMMGASRVFWNPSDKGSGVALAIQDLRASVSGAYEAVRAVSPQSAGKLYFEVTLLASSGNNAVVGVMQAGATLGHFVGSDASGYGYAADGQIYNNSGSVLSTGATYSAAGNVIQVAVDLSARKIWFRKVGTANWSGQSGWDPATATGGTSIFASGLVYAACSTRNAQGLTANFGASPFAASVPAGFRAWES